MAGKVDSAEWDGLPMFDDWEGITEEEFILLYPTTPNRELAERTGLSEATVGNRAFRLGLKKDVWTGFSEADFRRLFPVMDSQELADLMGVPKSTVTSRAQMLGIKKDEGWKRQRRQKNFRENLEAKIVAARRASRKLLPYTNEVIARYQAGASLEQIGAEYKVNGTTVANFLEDHSIPRRPPSNPMRHKRQPVPKGSYMGYGKITKEEFIARYPVTHNEDLTELSGLSEHQIKTRAQLLGIVKAKRKTIKTRTRLRASHLGKIMSKEQRKKISDAHIASPRVRRGANHPCWKGGITQPRNTGSPEYVAWRNAVLERDGYTCQNLSAHSTPCTTNIQAHHIRSWVDHIELRYAIDNGIALCEQCHIIIGNGNKKVKTVKIRTCACGCGKIINGQIKNGEPRHYARNHSLEQRGALSAAVWYARNIGNENKS